MDERIVALGVYEAAKKKLLELGMRAGSHLETLRKETDTLLTRRDFLQIDFETAAVLVADLKKIQSEAKIELRTIDELNSTYKFD